MLVSVLELNGLDIEEIAEALADQECYEHLRLIDPRSGQIVFWSADTGIDGHSPIDLDELDPELVAVHPLPSWIWYQDMADFAAMIADQQAGQRLAQAIEGKGAFRRFKDVLHQRYPGLLPAWYAFRDTRALRRAVEWLAENDLISPEEAARFVAGHPDPQAR
jgi:Uncharacterised protein family (UPF0158)